MDKPGFNPPVNPAISSQNPPQSQPQKDLGREKVSSVQSRSLTKISDEKGLIVREGSLSPVFLEASKSEKIESVFTGAIRASDPSPQSIVDTRTPPPRTIYSFASIRIEADPFFKRMVLTHPEYSFDIYVNEKKISLTGGGIDPATGSLVNAGGFGRIFSATDPETGKKIAVKVATSPSSQSQAALEKEGLALLEMGNAEYVVGASHVGFAEDILFAVMDYIEGPVLIDRMMAEDLPPLTLKEKIGFISDVVKGVKELHDAGYAHRDIKLDNIILENGVKARVIDLGFAKKDEEKTRLMEGTPFYLPPEIYSSLLNPKNAEYKALDSALKQFHTKAVDIYSLGICIYAILQGSFPPIIPNFSDERDVLTKLSNNFNINDRAFEKYQSTLGEEDTQALRDAVQNCLERFPEDRPTIDQLFIFFEGLQNELQKK